MARTAHDVLAKKSATWEPMYSVRLLTAATWSHCHQDSEGIMIATVTAIPICTPRSTCKVIVPCHALPALCHKDLLCFKIYVLICAIAWYWCAGGQSGQVHESRWNTKDNSSFYLRICNESITKYGIWWISALSELGAKNPDVASCGCVNQNLWRQRFVQNTASTCSLKYKPLRVSNHYMWRILEYFKSLGTRHRELEIQYPKISRRSTILIYKNHIAWSTVMPSPPELTEKEMEAKK